MSAADPATTGLLAAAAGRHLGLRHRVAVDEGSFPAPGAARAGAPPLLPGAPAARAATRPRWLAAGVLGALTIFVVVVMGCLRRGHR